MELIGLISDTHGLVRPSVFEALKGVELILHAGDVGDGVLDELRTIAPVQAVYGNTDPIDSAGLVQAIDMEVGGLRIHVSHGHELGVPTPERLLARYDADVIVYGHTHRQHITQVQVFEDDVAAGSRWAVNPGAAGARRFKLEPSCARMTIRAGVAEFEIVELT